MAAEKKISDMDTAGTLSGAEYFEIVQSGENKKVALNVIDRLGDDFEADNFLCTSAAPGVSALVAAGSGPTISIAGNNECGVVTLTTGTSATTGALFRITLNTYSYPTSCVLVLQAGDADAAPIMVDLYATGTANTVTVTAVTALADGTQYLFNYHIKGY